MTKMKKIFFLALLLTVSMAGGAFADLAKLNTARAGGYTTTLLPNGNILVTGGYGTFSNPANYYKSAEIYVSSKGVFEPISSMNLARSSHTATLLPNGKVIIYGGFGTDGTARRTYEIFDPNTNSFSTTVSSIPYGTGQGGHTATLLTQGPYKNNVIWCGGKGSVTSSSGIANCRIYNPETNSVSSINMRGGRYDHTATLLSNGNVLIAGGRTAGNYLVSTDLYDVGENAFTLNNGALVVGRRDHAAVSLNNGKTAIIGGYNENFRYSSDYPYDIDTDDNWYNEDGAPSAKRHNPGYQGYLDSVELFDKYGKPTVISGPDSGIKTMPYRLARSAAALDPDGKIVLNGGRGNIPVTFANVSVTFLEGSILKSAGAINTNTIGISTAASTAKFELSDTTLSRTVSGHILNGDIYIPTSDEDGIAVKVGDEDNGQIQVKFHGRDDQDVNDKDDVKAILDNVKVGRYYDKDKPSGNLAAKSVVLKDLAGTVTFSPFIYDSDEPKSALLTYDPNATSSANLGCSNDPYQYIYIYSIIPTIKYAIIRSALFNVLPDNFSTTYTCYDSINSQAQKYVRLSSASLTLELDDIPKAYRGAKLTGNLQITGFKISGGTSEEFAAPFTIEGDETTTQVAKSNFYNVSPTCSGSGDNVKCKISFPVTFSVTDHNALIGIIKNDNDEAITFSTITFGLANNIGGYKFDEVSAEINFYADQVDLTDESYAVDVSTIVIRDMIFSNTLSYNPANSTWDSSVGAESGDTLYEYTASQSGSTGMTALLDHTLIIPASGSPVLIGGKGCRVTGTATCKRLNQGSPVTEPDRLEVGTGGLFIRNSNEMLPVMRTYPTGGSGGQLNTPRQGHTTTALPNKDVLVCGGSDGTQALSSCELYSNETKKWSYTGSMKTPRSAHTSTLLPNGKVIVVGGTDGNGPLNTAEIYNPKTGNFTESPVKMSYPRQNHTATLLPNGNIFVVGGSTGNLSGLYSNSYEVFVTTKNEWMTKYSASAAPPVSQHTATLMKTGCVAVIGGIKDSLATSDYRIYCPMEANNSPKYSGTISVAGHDYKIYSHVSVLDMNGNIWLIGGSNGNYPSSSVIKFTPESNGNISTGTVAVGTLVGSLPAGVTGHTAILTPDNYITVLGGKTVNSAVGFISRIKTELNLVTTLMDPNAIQPRANHSTVLDAEGHYLVIGGDNGRGVYYRDVERNYFTVNPDEYTSPSASENEGDGLRIPKITNTLSENARPGEPLTLYSTGTANNFHGFNDASSGKGIHHNTPRMMLMQMDNTSGFLVDVSTRIYVNSGNDWNNMISSITAILPGQVSNDGSGYVNPELPWGHYYALTSLNGQFSNFKIIQVGENWDLPTISSAPSPFSPREGHYYDHYVPPVSTNYAIVPSTVTGYTVYKSSIVWTWPNISADAFPYITGYEVYSATTSDAAPSLGRVGQTTSQVYPFFVQTGLPSNFPAQISVVPYNIWTEGDTPKTSNIYYTLASSVSLNIGVTDLTTAYLDWSENNPNSDGTCYQVEYCKANPGISAGDRCFDVGNFASSGTFANTSFETKNCYNHSTFTATGLTPATGYYFRVKAINGTRPDYWNEHINNSGYETEYSQEVTTVTLAPIQTVSGNAIYDGTFHSIVWKWQNIDKTYPVTFNVTQVVPSSGTYTPVSKTMTCAPTQTDCSITWPQLLENTLYQVKVEAEIKVYNSDISDYDIYKSSPVLSEEVYTLAAPPTSMYLSAERPDAQATSQSVSAVWQGTFEKTFYVEISTSSDFSSIASSATVSSTDSYKFDSLLPNTYYFGRVTSMNAAGEPSTHTVTASTLTYPNPIKDLVLTPSAAGIKATWDTNQNNSSTTYKVFISTDPNFTPVVTRTDTTLSNEYSFYGLLTETAYHVKVQAENLEGSISNILNKSATTESGPSGTLPGSISGETNPQSNVNISGKFLNGRYVSLDIPAAAYSIPTAMAISPAEGEDYCQQNIPGMPIITAKIYTDNQNPQVPIDFTIGYFTTDAEKGYLEPVQSEILLARFNGLTHECLPLRTTFNSSTNRITASINTLDYSTGVSSATVIQVIRKKAPATLSEAKIYPNPMYPSRGDGYVTIEPVPLNTKLTLYTLSGAKVWEDNSNNSFVIIWKGENKYGNPVASGIYLGVLESPSGKKNIKIAVER